MIDCIAPMELKHTLTHYCYKGFTPTELKYVTAYFQNRDLTLTDLVAVSKLNVSSVKILDSIKELI
ncbi:MAG: hypothetical protein HOI55_08260 [Candidatus Marinimicrobia bacterium]|jgi:hypothetical protein|nr:hypothetical protein [Candidatus Neomarinimicrobiota bacterium]